MLDYAWFRLLVRAIGVVLIGLGLPAVVSMLLNIANYLLTDRSIMWGWTSFWQSPAVGLFVHVIASLTQLAAGAYLLFGGKRLIAFCIRDVLDHCAACGYDLRRVGAPNCPECGIPIHARPHRTPPGVLPTP